MLERQREGIRKAQAIERECIACRTWRPSEGSTATVALLPL
jgi:hypothetical protein